MKKERYSFTHFTVWTKICSFLQAAIFGIIMFYSTGTLSAADIFGLYAPPGSISLNSSYEWSSDEILEVQVEHEGAAITDWFMVLDKGQAADYSIRQANQGTDLIEYQVYKESSPYTNVILAQPESLTDSSVVTSSDFGTVAAATEIISFYFYFNAAASQFLPSGVYTDTLVLSLYKGAPETPGDHEFVESVSVSVTIRMAELMDVYMDREPGITSLDLATAASDMLVATTHERSNSALGYTVSITSENYADDQTGHSTPYLLHESSSEFIEYSLTYGGTAVSSWIFGSSKITDSSSITDSGTTWLDKELRISYSSSTAKPSGYYQDRLTITITAK